MPWSHPSNRMATKDKQRKIVKTYWPHHRVVYPQSAQAWSCSKDGCWANQKVSVENPKLYGDLVVGEQNRGHSQLRFKDVCKCDQKSLNMRTDELELLAKYSAKWRSTVHKRLKEREKEYY